MLKKILLPIIFLFCLFNLSAQEKSKVNLGIEIGLLDLSNSGILGIFLNVEPKLRSSENTAFGLRIGVTANSLTYENYDSTQFIINEESGNGVVSFVPTFDYYWNENKYRPNIGLGLGAYLLISYLDVSPGFIASPSEDVLEVNVKHQIGFLIRGGIEIGRSRLGLEYNFVRKADIEIPNGQIVGTVDRSYLGLSFGFAITGGKSSK